jgi:beta-xylosidase
MEFENRQYVIFDVSELDKIDFTQVLETSAETTRKSVDGTKTFVKWDNEVPACVESLTTGGDYLTHSEILTILMTEEWTPPYSANSTSY